VAVSTDYFARRSRCGSVFSLPALLRLLDLCHALNPCKLPFDFGASAGEGYRRTFVLAGDFRERVLATPDVRADFAKVSQK
jgi:hypothetical protein